MEAGQRGRRHVDAPGPRAGVRAPAAGHSHPPPPRWNKRGREGLKAALCLPKPDSPVGSPLGTGKQEKASSAQGAGAAAGREAGRPEARSPGRSWAAQLLTRGHCAPSVAGRSGPGTLTLQVVWTGAPGGRLSALSRASSFLLSRSEQHLGRDAPL